MAQDTRPPLHALIVEDNSDLARLFGDLLEVLGCTVNIEWNANAGLKVAFERLPDLVFCDLTMPGEKNGFDVAREIRANPRLKDTWLIAVTGYDTPETHARAKEAGFDRIFPKPVKFAQIQAVLDDVRLQGRVGASDAADTKPAS
ncbi:response regulator [Noviherbaspirillum sp. CPCC 100848]|uniref:Response regulator n=1 Tax=Noviherbaspirillum album TaxID=3080276 RepID=A0ABU6J2T0_9BURK|nr:response regulator [Noviherbaspirillum sp. CPCC 100848]MEC4717941.1 response regulator [Noviherbaspirillum sp. CPCC 100848]